MVVLERGALSYEQGTPVVIIDLFMHSADEREENNFFDSENIRTKNGSCQGQHLSLAG